MKYVFFLLVLFYSNAYAKNYLDDNLKTMNWGGVEVIWLEDDSLPTYDVSIYFEEGAFGDRKGMYGETELMFNELTAGTHRYTHKEIVEALEFYGVGYGSRITHEYSSFHVSGLVRHVIPTMKMICHLFEDATFPNKELTITKKRIEAGMKSMVTNHSKLVNYIFRYESLKGTGLEHPTTGTLKSLHKIGTRSLKNRLDHFNTAVYKRIYIKGPKKIQLLENVFTNDCKWKKIEKRNKYAQIEKTPAGKGEILFVPVPDANQAQVIVGRTLTTAEVMQKQQELKAYIANYLGGGFTSQLFRTLRLERGLTYSAGALLSEQRNYGRSMISSFTKNETIVELLNSIKEVIEKSSTKINPQDFEISRKNIKGNYLLSLESTSDFLQNLLNFDHNKRDYEDIYKFSRNIDRLTIEDVQKGIAEYFGWDKQVILVLGDKSLVKTLQKAGFKVKVKSYKQYL